MFFFANFFELYLKFVYLSLVSKITEYPLVCEWRIHITIVTVSNSKIYFLKHNQQRVIKTLGKNWQSEGNLRFTKYKRKTTLDMQPKAKIKVNENLGLTSRAIER